MKHTVCLLFSLNVPMCTLHNTSRTQKTAQAAKNSGFQIIRKNNRSSCYVVFGWGEKSYFAVFFTFLFISY